MNHVCCNVRLNPSPNPIRNVGPRTTGRGTYESCQGAACSRSGSPDRGSPAFRAPKPACSCSRPQTAPSVSVKFFDSPPSNSAAHEPHDSHDSHECHARPASARLNRSYNSCKFSNCSRSPSPSPRALEESVLPYEKLGRPLSPPGWTYSPKRTIRRGQWWDKDWEITRRYIYHNPDLQPCGCHKSKVHHGSRTPSPPRSSRAIGLEYHYSRLANANRNQANQACAAQRQRLAYPKNPPRDGFGHRHEFDNWSCSASGIPSRQSSRSRSSSPRSTGSPRCSAQPSGSPFPIPKYTCSRPPSPGPCPARSHAPLRERPRIAGAIQQSLEAYDQADRPTINSHGHCHTYNAWSCSPSPKAQTHAKSRDSTPPRSRTPTATINVSYNPGTTPTQTLLIDSSDDVKGLRPGCKIQQQQHQHQHQQDDSYSTPYHGHEHCHGHGHCGHIHHCHHMCHTCGHHGHHGKTLFNLPSLNSSDMHRELHNEHHDCHHHHHHCHCFHSHHHHC